MKSIDKVTLLAHACYGVHELINWRFGLSGYDGSVIGARARSLRRSRRVTLDTLATEMGLSKGHLSRFERGEKTLSVSALIRLADALNVTVGNLCDEKVNGGGTYVVSEEDREYIPMSQSPDAASYAILTGGPTPLPHHTLLLNIPALQKTPEPANHSGREGLFIISGRVILMVERDQFDLKRGDYVEFDARHPHSLSALNEDSQVLLTILPD